MRRPRATGRQDIVFVFPQVGSFGEDLQSHADKARRAGTYSSAVTNHLENWTVLKSITGRSTDQPQASKILLSQGGNTAPYSPSRTDQISTACSLRSNRASNEV